MQIPSEKQLQIWYDEHLNRLKRATDDVSIQALWACYARGEKCNPASYMSAPLLTYEMAYARSHGRLPSSPDNRTLVILVGESFHPLLQTIEAHQPTRLVGVVNRMYGDEPYAKKTCGNCRKGENFWELLYRCVQFLPAAQNFESTKCIVLEKEEEERPFEVFHKLRDALRDDLANLKKEVVVDITGAKKTMLAGAFMLAAYTRAKISYVDSHLFDNGKPVGYSFHIRHLDNPLEHLFLDIWENIEMAYEQYDFAEARRLLTSIQKELNDTKLQKLEHYLEICADWQNGQLRQAKEKKQNLKFSFPVALPPAIEELGDLWPEPKDITLNPDFFFDSEKVIVYGYDELARVQKLRQQENFRAAFARAYALHETLIKARLFKLLGRKDNKSLLIVERKKEGNKWEIDEAFTHNRLIKEILRLNTQPALDVLDLKHASLGKNIRLRCKPETLTQDEDTKPEPINLWERNKLVSGFRNLVTHSYFPVSTELAQKAIHLAEDNLEDFKDNWTNLKERKVINTTFPTWQDIQWEFELTMIPIKRSAANGR